MREELIDIKDLSDSREVMTKKAPRGITIFLLIVATILVVALTWAYFGKLDTYVKASGEIRSAETLSTIVLPNGGKLAAIHSADGCSVQAGDVLFEFDSDYYISQRDLIQKQITEKENDIANSEKLIRAIRQDKNLFDANADAV